MKKFYLIFFALLSCKTFDYKDRYEASYNGNPKKVQISVYEPIVKGDSIITGNLKYSTVSLFDKKNRLYKDYSINSKGDTTMINERLYNKKERIIKTICHKGDISSLIAIYYFDEDFKADEFHLFNGRNKNPTKMIFEFKENGIDYDCLIYGVDNKLRDKSLHIHDKKSRFLKLITYNLEDNTIKSISENVYDKNDNVIKKNWFRGANLDLKSYSVSKYDAYNNCYYSESFSGGNSNSVSSITSIDYKYDKKGNIIYMLYKKNDKPSFIKKSDITY